MPRQAARPLRRLGPTVAAAVALLAGCSGSDGDGGGTAPTTAAAPAGASTTAALPGERFTDPDGTYTLQVSPDWADQFAAAPAKGIEVWQVAPSVDGFAANVNVITQETPGADLEEYLAASTKDMGTMTVVSSKVVNVGDRRLGVVEYRGTPAGTSRALHFLGVVDVVDDVAVLATLTATEDAFTTLAPTIERYLLTLART